MPDFGKYTNYSEKTAFNSVVFGAQAPVLEVELNEVQEIFNNKLKLLSTLMGDTILVPKSGSISYDLSSMRLTITNCVAVVNGIITLIPSASVVMSTTNTMAYFRLTEKVVTSKDTLTEYGKVNGVSIKNPIIDPRLGVETSQRKVITHSLECAGVMPSSVPNSGVVFLKVGELVNTDGSLVFSMTGVLNNLPDILDSLGNKMLNIETAKIVPYVENKTLKFKVLPTVT